MRKILSHTRRAVDDYNMIESGDRIAVGVSGGKDSLVLLCAMHALKRFYPKEFHLEALTLDMGAPGMDFSGVKKLCEELDIPYTILKTDIYEVIFEHRKEKSPCSLCAKMRRGGLNDLAKSRGLSKVCLGHHFDDVIETFFLSLFYEGRINCFSPVTYLDRSDITVIRPFIYLPEKEIKRYTKAENLPVVKNTCPADGNTKRQEMKELIRKLEYDNHGLKERVFTALKTSNVQGWNISEGEK